MNFLNGTLKDGNFYLGEFPVKVPEGKLKMLQKYNNKELILGIRPEDIHDEPVFLDASENSKFTATIDVAELMGAESYLYSKVNDQDFIARVDSRTDVSSGKKLELAFDMNKAHFFDPDDEQRIR
jgi:multiple sugar transport system ATP-binding protein